jgi:hypothetical protein
MHVKWRYARGLQVKTCRGKTYNYDLKWGEMIGKTSEGMDAGE